MTSSWPRFDDDEIKAVENVLRSGKVNYWTGNEVKEFQKDFAQHFQCRHALALANGSLALELALYGVGITEGDEVIVTPRSFIASVNCVGLRGGTPVFADVDPESGNITAESIRRVITERTKAVVLVHLAGWPCDMDPIMELAKKHNFYVIEDCAQSHGAMYKGRFCGSIGHVSAFSFCQDKILTTGGEGGMVCTNDTAMMKKMWSYKDHGKDYDWILEKKEEGSLYKSLGTNWRMTEMQAAIGRVMLKKLSKYVLHRRANAAILILKLLQRSDKIHIPIPPDYMHHAYYKFYLYHTGTKEERDQLLHALQKEGISCGWGSSSELYQEEVYAHLATSELPVAKQLGEKSIMLCVDPTLHTRDMIKTAQILQEYLSSGENSSSTSH